MALSNKRRMQAASKAGSNLNPLGRLGAALASEKARLIAFSLFLGFVFLGGGGSRDDILSLVYLRPAAVFFAAYAMLAGKSADLLSVRVPLAFLLVLAILIAVQLIPLPSGIWSQLPDRSAFQEIGRLLGLPDTWRPLTISPSKTWNALFSLTVPLAAILLYSIQTRANRDRIWPIVVAFGVFSAILGMLQVLGGPQSPLYTYRITNAGSPVGFFANRNHHAVFLCMVLLISGWLVSTTSLHANRKTKNRRLVVSGLAVAVALPVVIISGSRAGLILAFPAALGAALFVATSDLIPSKIKLGKTLSLSRRRIAILSLAISVLVAGVIAWSSSMAGLARIAQTEAIDEIRFQAFPTLLDMAEQHLLFGSGFGTFEYLYEMYEPDSLLGQRYLNEAHNDWLQWVIEGGAPAIVLLVTFIVWLGLRLRANLSKGTQGRVQLSRLAFGIILLLGIASLVDYPARVPIIMVMLAIAISALARNGSTLR